MFLNEGINQILYYKFVIGLWKIIGHLISNNIVNAKLRARENKGFNSILSQFMIDKHCKLLHVLH